MNSDVLAVIANYDFNDNAIRLKSYISQLFQTLLIDSSSPEPLKSADIVIPNKYYPGLWNEAINQAIKHDAKWLFFIASDIQFVESDMLKLCVDEVLASKTIVLWTPSLSPNSRYSFKSTGQQISPGMRYCSIPEGFCFLSHIEVLKKLHPLPDNIHYGYGVDRITALNAHSAGDVVVDDRVIIFHPTRRQEHAIDMVAVAKEETQFLSSFTFSINILQKIKELDQIAANNEITPVISDVFSLDLGCGKAVKSPFKAKNIIGVDIESGSGSDIVVAADLCIDPIPFTDSSFQCVSAYNLIQYIPNLLYNSGKKRFALIELMNEIFRVLTPGGIFLSLTPAYPHVEALEDPAHCNIITEKTFTHYFCKPYLLAKENGFNGTFRLVYQGFRDNGRLLTLLRAIKAS